MYITLQNRLIIPSKKLFFIFTTFVCKNQQKADYYSPDSHDTVAWRTWKHSSMMRTTRLLTVRASATRCQYRWGWGPQWGPKHYRQWSQGEPPVDRQTHMSENITVPTLRWRAVIIHCLSHGIRWWSCSWRRLGWVSSGFSERKVLVMDD